MSIRNNINQAEILYQSGDYQKSYDICQKILDKKPNLFDALQIQGLNCQARGDLKGALVLFDKAISVKPQHASTHNNMGNIYLALNDFVRASKCYSKALAIDALMAEALNNLATCQVKLSDIESAEVNYKKAILLDATKAEYQLNFGVLLTDKGEFNSAIEYLMRALELDQSKTSVYWHVFKIQMYLHRYQDAIDIATTGVLSQSLSEMELCELLIGRAMVLWLFYCFEEAEQAIALSENIYQFEDVSANMANMAIFHRYIKKLLSLRKGNQQLYLPKNEDAVKEMYFVSESHGFAPNGTIVNYNDEEYQIRSLFVLGAKVFHLIAEQDNKYQVSLATLLEGLSPGSKVVIAFGEIDCRNNEGVFAYCQKSGANFQNVIDKMLNSYIKTLSSIAEAYQLEIILYGVPAPHPYHINNLAAAKQSQFKQVISYFNEKLVNECKKYNINVLDVYSLTSDNGQSNLKYHIDGIHLSPQTIPELFDRL